jgi:hypothetical protein
MGNSRNGTLSSGGMSRLWAIHVVSAIMAAVMSRPGTTPPRKR